MRMKSNAPNKLWLEWNRAGFFPGIEETNEEFERRILFCQELKQNFAQEFAKELGASLSAHEEQSSEGVGLAKLLYGISPDWVPFFFSNYQLAPWHAGCAWIFKITHDAPQAALVQLRRSFLHKPHLFGVYQRDELIAHELAHVGRMNYGESQYEEILAYMSLSSHWRRWLGPIVQSSSETFIFLSVLLFAFLAQFSWPLWGIFLPFEVWMGVTLAPCLLFGVGLVRLILRRRIFGRCLMHLEMLYHNPETARHLIYRLTDAEIRRFASLSSAEIAKWIEKAADHSFRWQFLKENYPIYES